MENQECADAGVTRHTDEGQRNTTPHSLALTNLFKLADTAINGGKLDETPREKRIPSHFSEVSTPPATIQSDKIHSTSHDSTQIRCMTHDVNESPRTPLKNGTIVDSSNSTDSRTGSSSPEKVPSVICEKDNGTLKNSRIKSSDGSTSDAKEESLIERETNSLADTASAPCEESTFSPNPPVDGGNSKTCLGNGCSDGESDNHNQANASTRRQKQAGQQQTKARNPQTEQNIDEHDTEVSSVGATTHLVQKQADELENADKKGCDHVDQSSPQKKSVKKYPSRQPSGRLSSGIIARKPHDFVYEVLLELIRKVRGSVDPFGFFSGRVDPIEAECPDYYDVIDPVHEAMDLDTMEEMIESGSIRTVGSFESYLNRIVLCAKKYNTDEENFVRQEADKIPSLARPLLDVARRKLESRRGKPSNSRRDNSVEAFHESGFLSDVKGTPHITKRKRRRSEGADSDFSRKTSSMINEDDTQESLSLNAHAGNVVCPGVSERRTNRRATRSLSGGQRQCKGTKNDNEDNTVDDKSVAHLRPTRAAKRQVDYSESSLAMKHSGSEDEAENSAEESSSFLTPSPVSRRRRAQQKTPGLEGSHIPLAKKDLSSSLISSCSSREEWLSYCHEMIAVCNEAARQAALREDPDAERYDKPLSEVYMTERMEYQKPLQGFIVRAKSAPHHMQGFIVTTKFTTWRKSFKWTMDVAAAGITPTDRRLRATDDGSLTKELQNVDRTQEGEKSHQSVVFSRVAEIALLGGLGCGGYLVRRALSELRSSGDYDYVVLQSTKMAIPFYERLGFVRIGAVTRFRDNNLMPEVAYRHWSEIVDGEAIEASYMMGLRLTDSLHPPSSRQELGPRSVPESTRQAEILSALESAYSLLVVALTMRATGSTSYSNTYRDLLATAKDYAVSAQDKQLICVLDKATKEFTGSRIGQSKAMLREKLDLPKLRGIHRQSSTFSIDSEDSHAEKPLFERTGKSEMHPQRSFGVNIRVGGDSYRPNDVDQDYLSASIPVPNVPSLLLSKSLKRGGDWVHGNIGVSLYVGGSSFLPDMHDDTSSSEGRTLRSHRPKIDRGLPTLQASSYLPSRENRIDLQDSVATALENLHSFSLDPSSDQIEDVLDLPLEPGNSIMLKVPGYDGSPLWLPADVERRCRRHELPKEKGAHRSNSYVVKIVESYGTQKVSRMLDSSNRGVGREWATKTDWHSFPVLPPGILDAVLVGSWVHYPAEDGEVREGFITRRVGGGLDAEPKWRLSVKTTDVEASGEKEGTYEDLKAGALREAVNVSEEKMQRALLLLKTMGPPFRSKHSSDSSVEVDAFERKQESSDISDFDEEMTSKRFSDTEASSTYEATGMKPEDYASGWAAGRVEKYKLGATGSNEGGGGRTKSRPQGKKRREYAKPAPRRVSRQERKS